MACIGEATTGFPTRTDTFPYETATVAEVLVEQGYNTYMLGKWHLCPEDRDEPRFDQAELAVGRGFERFLRHSLAAETSQWHPDLVYDNHPVEQLRCPRRDITSSRTWPIGRSVSSPTPADRTDKPFFMYFCPGVAHAPHHVAPEWADKY